MLPLLLVALLVMAGVFAFIFSVDRKVSELEKRLSGLNDGQDREKNR